MCGISGFIHNASSHFEDSQSVALRMGEAIAYRGPDDCGAWADPRNGVALSHQRLSILDLSDAGHQPMHSASGRYVIAFNGEIYNHLTIRRHLDASSLATSWRGHSDTETLLAAVEAWGLHKALELCAGMWAFALVDRRKQQLHLVRDRFGEKPLYWGITGEGSKRALVFGSELAALRAYPGFNSSINRQALLQFLRFGHVPTPLSIYDGISKLQPGHIASIQFPLNPVKDLPSSRSWWQLTEAINTGYSEQVNTDAEALQILEDALVKSVVDQAIADVPVGAFLSGGIDSTLITALLQTHTSKKVRTFTIGFEESSFNEAPYARAIASYLGTEHVETTLTSSDALALIPDIPNIYSEPFADSSQLPTHLVCREARFSGLRVALSGDGGDELFGGYNRYSLVPQIWKRLGVVPFSMRRSLGSAVTRIPPSAWDSVSEIFKVPQLGHKAHKLGARLQHVRSLDSLYRSLICEWQNASSLLQGRPQDANNENAIDTCLPICLKNDPVARMMAWDSMSYLPDDILVKVDRAAMAAGLETRAPFLDKRVASVAWRLPTRMKIRNGSTKWVLRHILDKYMPRELIERPKAGFAIPLSDWLRGPLRSWSNELLNPERLKYEGYLKPEPIAQLWQQHLSGRYDHTTKLWTVLMWQAWLQQWK